MGYDIEDARYTETKTKTSKKNLLVCCVAGLLVGGLVGWFSSYSHFRMINMEKRLGIAYEEYDSAANSNGLSMEEPLGVFFEGSPYSREKWVGLYAETSSLERENKLAKMKECLKAKRAYERQVKVLDHFLLYSQVKKKK
ncbi:MAG: uncharacterized protein A8A55_1631 [Amphiamblys sp. WSBS2006]|nr:MAG: uncharacterized protein A8A55_1631 [Amphiamblys sp. WSBS2006]